MRIFISILFILSCVSHAFADDYVISNDTAFLHSMDEDLDKYNAPILTIKRDHTAKLEAHLSLEELTIPYYYGYWSLNKDTLCIYDSLIRTQFDDAPYFVIQPDGYRIQKNINTSSNGIHIKIIDANNQAIKGYKIKYYCDSSADYSSNENGDIFINRYPNDNVYDYYTLNFTLPFPNYPVQRSLPVEKKFNDITLNIDPVYTHDFIQVTKRYYLVKDDKLTWLYFKQEGTCFFNYDHTDYFFSFKKK